MVVVSVEFIFSRHECQMLVRVPQQGKKYLVNCRDHVPFPPTSCGVPLQFFLLEVAFPVRSHGPRVVRFVEVRMRLHQTSPKVDPATILVGSWWHHSADRTADPVWALDARFRHLLSWLKVAWWEWSESMDRFLDVIIKRGLNEMQGFLLVKRFVHHFGGEFL